MMAVDISQAPSVCLDFLVSITGKVKCSMQSYGFCVIPDGMAEIYPTSHQTSIITPLKLTVQILGHFN